MSGIRLSVIVAVIVRKNLGLTIRKDSSAPDPKRAISCGSRNEPTIFFKTSQISLRYSPHLIMLSCKTYYDHECTYHLDVVPNGRNHDVTIYPNVYDEDTETDEADRTRAIHYPNVQFMVGSHVWSSLTRTASYQPDAEHIDNAFLVCTDPASLKYTLVSGKMFEFVANAPITHFYSPIHNGLAYPYAIDTNGLFYLIDTAIIVTPPDGVQFDVRPSHFCPFMRVIECVRTFNNLSGIMHDNGGSTVRLPFRIQNFVQRFRPNTKFWSRDQCEMTWIQIAQSQDELCREICTLSNLAVTIM